MVMTIKYPARTSLKSPLTSRRGFLICGLAGVVGAVWIDGLVAATPGDAQPLEVNIEQFSADGKSLGFVKMPKVAKTAAQWRSQLSALAYQVTREEGTELPYSGEYASNHADGLYHCICCDTVLFDSKTKYESGTGWPSFWQAISAANVVKSSDSSFGMQRDAISCRRCDAHLGHVFDDGPRPTGLRYCMNSVSLHFVRRG
jgi:peptide-methionine (R)-S-oxide reductase